MIEISIGASDTSFLEEELLAKSVERCAVLYAEQTRRSDGLIRLLVTEIEIPSEEDYLEQSEFKAVLRPRFVAQVTKRASRAERSLIFVHSHLGPSPPSFSWIDDEGETHLAKFLANRHPSKIHCAIVISQGGVRARELGTDDAVRVVSLGERRVVLFCLKEAVPAISGQFDRQVLAFGIEGQQIIQGLRVAIVGLGGTGSLISQQLVHLGVRKFVLIDPDLIEETNLNRIVGATEKDLSRPKVEVAAEYIDRFAPTSIVTQIIGDIVRTKIAQALTEADFIFGCTDSHGSRAILQQICYQYHIPCIDMGSTITTDRGTITHIFGRIQLLSPGLACLHCSGLLDSEAVRRDMMSPFERTLDPYITGEAIAAPSVISLNGTVSSLAVTMFMAVITGIPGCGRHLLYNGLKSTLRDVRTTPAPNCYICSKSGTLAKADSFPLYARED